MLWIYLFVIHAFCVFTYLRIGNLFGNRIFIKYNYWVAGTGCMATLCYNSTAFHLFCKARLVTKKVLFFRAVLF